jgi:hypothetical protein
MARTKGQSILQYRTEQGAAAQNMATWGTTLQTLMVALRALVAQQFLLCNDDFTVFSHNVVYAHSAVFTQHLYDNYQMVETVSDQFFGVWLHEWFLEEMRAINAPLSYLQTVHLKRALQAQVAEAAEAAEADGCDVICLD